MDIEKELKPLYPSLQIYTSSLQTKDIDYFAEKNTRKVGCGDIIIATNLAGRGTDFKTNSQLEAKGGLHVILTFSPENVGSKIKVLVVPAAPETMGVVNSSSKINLGAQSESFIGSVIKVKQRLEMVAAREVKKIEFEHELLTGNKKENLEGFSHC